MLPWTPPLQRTSKRKAWTASDDRASEAVPLPKGFHLPGTEVRARRLRRGVLLEPMLRSAGCIQAIFAEIDRLGGDAFLPEGRPAQPPMPPADDVLLDQ